MRTPNLHHRTFHRLLALALLLALLGLPAGRPLPTRAAGPYVVNLVSDGPDSNLGDGLCYDGVNGCTLRAALQQASADGVATTITFAPELTGATLAPLGVYGTLIWAGSQITLDGQGSAITLSGQNLGPNQSLLQIQGNNNTVRYLTFRDAPADGIQVGDFAGVGYGNGNTIEFVAVLGNGWSGIYVHGTADGGRGNVIRYSWIGAFATNTACGAGNVGEGIFLDQLASDTYIHNNDIVCNGGDGIKIDGQGGSPTGVQIRDNLIGTTGTTGMGNADAGILDVQASGTVIAGNVIVSSGGDGVELRGSSNAVVAGNQIGFLVSPTPLPNNYCGVTIIDGGHGNRVGGVVPDDRNVIGGNKLSGVCLEGGATGNTVDGNYIGTDATGDTAIPNLEAGIYVSASPGNYIGSGLPGVVQLISGNEREGIYIENANGNMIGPSSWIGVNSSGINPLGNGLTGIRLIEVNSTYVVPDVVAFNGGAGIALTGTGKNNTLAPSTVRNNAGLPIDLGDDGPTPNDPGDGDGGPNGLLNHPEITGGSGSTAWGTACNSCTVIIYDAIGDPRAAGGGGSWLMVVAANTSGIWTANLPSGFTASDITAVACEEPCDSSSTSEMSPRWGVQTYRVFLPLVVRH